jgi:hypothetical protein
METYGQNNALKIQKYLDGECNDNLFLQLLPCLKKSIFIVSKIELNTDELNVFIRTLLDTDQKIATYIHNRILGKNNIKNHLCIGNYMDKFPNILGIVVFGN